MADKDIDPSKRDFLGTVTVAVGGVGVVASGGMFVGSMLPTREVAAQANVEVDISDISPGEGRTIEWQGSPVFIIHRTPEQIARAAASKGGKEPQPDKDRVKQPQWLILIGSCTHMGCVPNRVAGGWFCPCHGSGMTTAAGLFPVQRRETWIYRRTNFLMTNVF